MPDGPNLDTHKINVPDKVLNPLLTDAISPSKPETSPFEKVRGIYDTLLYQVRSKLEQESGIVADTDFWAVLIKENKLTKEGKEFAQALYAAINFGSPDEVKERVEGLKKIRGDIKTNMDIAKEDIRLTRREIIEERRILKEAMAGKREPKAQVITLAGREFVLPTEEEELSIYEDSAEAYKNDLTKLKLESLFLHRVVSSIEMQVSHNEMAAIREELYADQFSNSSWGRVVRRAISSDPDRVDLNQRENKFYVNSAAHLIHSLRKGVLSEIKTNIEENPGHHLYGRSDEELMDFLRVAERTMIENKLARIDRGEITCREFGDFFRAIYGEEPGRHEYSPLPKYMEDIQIGIKTEKVNPTTMFEEIINNSMRRAVELKALEVEQIEAKVRPQPSRWEKVVAGFRKAVQSGVALTTSIAGVLGILKGLGEASSAQAIGESSKRIYQEYSRQESLGVVALPTAEFSFELPVTEMQNLSQATLARCLSPVKTKSGKTAWVYNEKAKDDEICTAKFPGIKFVGTIEYKNVLPEGMLDIPEEYKDKVLISNFSMNTEQGATCSLTSITSIVNWFREKSGLPRLHSAVFSDMAQRKTNMPKATREKDSAKFAAPTRSLGEYSDLNLFYIDPIGLGENFEVTGRAVSIRDIFGGSSDGNVRREYLKNHWEGVGNNLLSHFLDQIKTGNFPTVASSVSSEFGHVVMVVGGGIDKDNLPYLLVAEPNGGYTGWEYTTGHWEKVGKNGLVKIPLDAYNLDLLAEYDEHMSFSKYDPEKEKELEVKWIEPELVMPFYDVNFTKLADVSSTLSAN